jgi:integrase/recombinase XerD
MTTNINTRTLTREFLASRRARGLASKTIAWYQTLLEPFSRMCPFLTEDPANIEGFLGALSMSDETRHGYYRALRAFYRWLSRRHALVNPMDDIGVPRRRKKTPYSLTTTELGWLLMVPLSARDRSLLCLLIDTGVRIGEAVNLAADDVFQETIIVSGKTGQREIPISPETRAQLIDLADHGRIFTGTKGTLTRSGAYRIVRLAMTRAGISARKWGPHTLRHTFGRQYLMAGGDLVSLQRILGHSDIKTTRIYAELDLRDVTHQHHRFTPLKIALGASQLGIWRGPAPESGSVVKN